MPIHKVETIIAGRTLSIETGELAPQAEGAVVVRYGDTVVLSTSVSADKAREDASYFPLSVDIIERMYAAGKIKGSRFIKREGRPSDWAILTGRLTDRTLRPLFPKESRNEVQILSTLLSVDFTNEPEVLSIIGASAALSVSAAPFSGPVAAVKIGYLDDQIIVNPTPEQLEKSKLDLVVAGTADAINMVEAGAHEVSESIIVEGLKIAHEEIKKIVALQQELIAKINPAKKEFTCKDVTPAKFEEIKSKYANQIAARLDDDSYLRSDIPDLAIKHMFADLEDELVELVDEQSTVSDIQQGFFLAVREQIRANILSRGQRPDKRALDQIRPIACQVGIIPRTHGSALFTRGGTQALTITTLASSSYEQILDDVNLEDEYKKRYIHHYSAMPYSVGEAGRVGIPKRREIGHGALAERALEPVL
ncbi:MAG TPA: polyribonucleotide nucleotidyltransferase, partial [bacterium]|nr:polyribonucleotide nucleotidyltransferase [bacterium]